MIEVMQRWVVPSAPVHRRGPRPPAAVPGLAAVLGLVFVFAVTGCAGARPPAAGAVGSSASAAPAGPGQPAGSGTAAGPACVAPAGPAVVGAVSGPPVPDLTLRCFLGGEVIRVADLRGPVIINLWASWCEPCRAELPALQRYATRASGHVRVVGVVTRDGRDAAASVIADQGLTFPMLEDHDQRLLAAVGKSLLPVSLFVNDGHIVYVYNATALDEPTIELMAERFLGVVVPR